MGVPTTVYDYNNIIGNYTPGVSMHAGHANTADGAMVEATGYNAPAMSSHVALCASPALLAAAPAPASTAAPEPAIADAAGAARCSRCCSSCGAEGTELAERLVCLMAGDCALAAPEAAPGAAEDPGQPRPARRSRGARRRRNNREPTDCAALDLTVLREAAVPRMPPLFVPGRLGGLLGGGSLCPMAEHSGSRSSGARRSRRSTRSESCSRPSNGRGRAPADPPDFPSTRACSTGTRSDACANPLIHKFESTEYCNVLHSVGSDRNDHAADAGGVEHMHQLAVDTSSVSRAGSCLHSPSCQKPDTAADPNEQRGNPERIWKMPRQPTKWAREVCSHDELADTTGEFRSRCERMDTTCGCSPQDGQGEWSRMSRRELRATLTNGDTQAAFEDLQHANRVRCHPVCCRRSPLTKPHAS